MLRGQVSLSLSFSFARRWMMERMIDFVEVLKDWEEQNSKIFDRETFEDGYNFAMVQIRKREEWVFDGLLAIVAMNKEVGVAGEFERGVVAAVDKWRGREK